MFRKRIVLWSGMSLGMGILLHAIPLVGLGQETLPATTPAVSKPEEGSSVQLRPELIEDLRKRISASPELSDEQKKSGDEAARKALDLLKLADSLKLNRTQLEERIRNIDEERKKLAADLESFKRERIAKAWLGDDIAVLEQQLANLQQQLIQQQSGLDAVEKQIAGREDRLKTLRERIAQNPSAVASGKLELTRLESSTDPPMLVEARRTAVQADLLRLEAEPAALQTEINFLNAQDAAGIVQIQRQIASEKVTRLTEQIAEWQKTIERSKRQDAETRREQARNLAERESIPILRDLYQSIVPLVDEELSIREKARLVKEDISLATQLSAAVDTRYQQVRNRESRLGASTSFGIRLREERQRLPDPNDLDARIRRRGEAYEETQLKYLNLRDDRRELDRLDRVIEQTVQSIGTAGFSDEERVELEDKVRTVYERELDNLDRLLSAYEDYIESMNTLSLQQEELGRKSREFRAYIDERVLWIPSHRLLTWNGIISDTGSLSGLVDPEFWKELARTLRLDAVRRPVLYFLAVVGWLSLFFTQSRQRASIQRWGQKASSRLNTSFAPTSSALVWTLVRASVLPAPIMFLGWRAAQAGLSPQVTAAGRNVMVVAATAGCLEFIRVVCRGNGLGAAHFQWPKRVNDLIAVSLSSFLAVATPLGLIVAFMRAGSDVDDAHALERVFLIAILLLLTLVLHRLTSSENGILKEWTQAHPDGWLARFSALIHPVAVAVPLVLAGLTVVGYGYAAEQLTVKLTQTVMLVFLAVFLRAMLFRWLTLRQRRLAIEQARELRAAMSQSERDKEPNLAEAQEARANLMDVSAQSKRLLNTMIVVGVLLGLVLIWGEVLPAIYYFDQRSIPGLEISYSDAALALLTVIVTTTAARNVPGLIEILLLEHLPIDRSARYAILAIARYVIVVLGILLISNEVGIGWQHVQWLAAALTFGLGFGLQEIFANFVSGLIILFEQPVRVGDIVTLDGTTGTVTRIRMRSTTITDWDRKDYVVPNKEFITGKLLNWTLSDTVNRVKLSVGVAYGSDPDQVQRILIDILRTEPFVLADPEPRVFFESFGDSALNFTLFAFLPEMDKRLPTIHSLNTRIHRRLGEAGIEIPFPQRDLHIRSSVDVPIKSPPIGDRNPDTEMIQPDLMEAVD